MAEALRASGVSVYRGSREIIANVSLSVQYGSLLAIVGPNGAGKSSLLKALAGLLPHRGSVHVADARVSSLSTRERARAIGYVPQRSAMADGVSVYDVVAQARYAHREPRVGLAHGRDPRVEQALMHTDLLPLARRTFDTLSGGEQRRVLTARALASEARVLLLDEPTAGLDVAHVLRFFRLLDALRRDGYALLCVLHDLREVRRNADSALLLARGQCVALGAARSVLSSESVREVYGVHAHEKAALGFSLDGAPP